MVLVCYLSDQLCHSQLMNCNYKSSSVVGPISKRKQYQKTFILTERKNELNDYVIATTVI